MKKITFYLLTAFAIIISIIIINACSENDNPSNDNHLSNLESLNFISYNKNIDTEISYSNEKYAINFKSNTTTKNTTAGFEIEDIRTKNIIHKNKFTLNKKLPSYKLGVFKKIEDVSRNLKNSLPEERWIELRNSYERFLKLLVRDIDNDKYQSDLIQSTFYQLSILNTIVRSYKNNDCECTPLPAYFVGKSSFWCQEDYLFGASNMLKHFNDNKMELLSFKDGSKVYKYVKDASEQKEYISYKELFDLRYSIKEYKNAVIKLYNNNNNNNNISNKSREDCWLGILGSDLGCCGNYSGCCWVATMDCFWHDVECLNCDHWHCGPACTPGF